MSLRKSQLGFTVFEFVLILAFVGIVALVGYTVHNRQQKTVDTGTSSTESSQDSGTVSSAPAVNSTSDLDSASQVLDQNDPGTANSSDSSQLDNETNGY